MIYAIISLVIAMIIGFGRQTAAFGKVRTALWFFPNFEVKRVVFALASIAFSALAINNTGSTSTILVLTSFSALFILFSFFFDMKYFFPEVNTVERQLGKTLKIQGSTAIIGVVVNDTPVAYPLDVVIPRHIINDTIGDLAIVVSYCAICRSALIFNAQVDGKALYLKVSAVWRRNMLMIDNQTKSLWQQATGECIYGKLKGKKMELLSGENTTWESWLKKYPNSEYAHKCIEARKGYLTRKAMIKGLNFITPKITPPGFSSLEGLPTRETVFGIVHNNISRAYPRSVVENLVDFTDHYDDMKLELHYDKQSNSLTAIESISKKPIIVERHWWLGWKEFHPDTEIWEK